MTAPTQRPHLSISGASPGELGRSRGEQLRGSLATAYAAYARLFRVVGASEERERAGAEAALAAIDAWRPESGAELRGIAAGSGLPLLHVVALNARTEILATGSAAVRECSTVVVDMGGRRRGVQTWDWHVELDEFWHTQEVAGPGLRFAGLSEQGIVGKIGMNEAGLGLHFNILGHRDDAPGGVPMHVLATAVLAECRSIDAAIAVIREAPIASSSSFTMLEAGRSVTAELSPVGVFVTEERAGSVQRTNHFFDPVPLAGQKAETYEPDSSERLALLRERLAGGLPGDDDALVALLASAEGEAALTCRPDPSKGLGERWGTLATILTDPAARTIRVLGGTPLDAGDDWRTMRL